MRIHVLDEAEDDLQNGRRFYDRQGPGVGAYYSLILFAGIHPREFGFYRTLSKRFPFGIYYLFETEVVQVYAVLDLRRDPAWIRRRLRAKK